MYMHLLRSDGPGSKRQPYIRYMYTYTVIWEMFMVKIFLCRAGEPGKLNTQIYTCIYNEHFVCLNFMGCHNPQKYSNRKILHTKK